MLDRINLRAQRWKGSCEVQQGNGRDRGSLFLLGQHDRWPPKDCVLTGPVAASFAYHHQVALLLVILILLLSATGGGRSRPIFIILLFCIASRRSKSEQSIKPILVCGIDQGMKVPSSWSDSVQCLTLRRRF